MSAPESHTVILPPPYSGMHENPQDMYKHMYEYWKRTGGYESAISNIKGLKASVKQLNTLIGIRTDETVQQQINLKANKADLGTMASQNANNVNITGGTIDGVNISGSDITIVAGSSTESINVAGTLHTDTTERGNIGGGEDILITYPMPANVLNTKGQFLEVTAWGIVAANANNKRIKFKIGSTILLDTTAVAANSGSWVIDAKITRSGTNKEDCITKIVSSNTLIIDSANYVEAAEDMTSNMNIFCTGEATADDDIVQKGMLVKWFNN
jgi:hypothetical protein